MKRRQKAPFLFLGVRLLKSDQKFLLRRGLFGFVIASPRNNRGFSLLEVLVAFSILSFGLLGIIGVYIQSLKRVEDLYRGTLVFSRLISMREDGNECLVCNSRSPNSECKCNDDFAQLCFRSGKEKQCLEL